MNKDLIRQIINSIAVIVTLVVNGLANGLPLNGKTTASISDSFDVFFVPAGYVFAIWGVIYVGLIVFGVYQALPAQRNNPRLQKIGYWFALSCFANSVWIFLWHYEQFALTLVAMLTLLISLIIIYLRLDIGRGTVRGAEKWAVNVPFSVYLGWISVATIANVTDLLDYLNWNGAGIAPEVWAVIMLAIAVVIGLLMSVIRKDIAYLMVLAWAFAGIGVKQANTQLVATGAWIATAFVIAWIALALVNRTTRKPIAHAA